MRAVKRLLPFVIACIFMLTACSEPAPRHGSYIVDVPAAISAAPTDAPSNTATAEPTDAPTEARSEAPSEVPTDEPTKSVSDAPVDTPDLRSAEPNETPPGVEAHTQKPTASPSPTVTAAPTPTPTNTPKPTPTPAPITAAPTQQPTAAPTQQPTDAPTQPNYNNGSKIMYLTFDDGPCENTLRVLDILDRYNIKATFFTVGYFVDRNPEIAAEIVRRGQLIACHSYTHDFTQCYASADAFIAEVHRWEEAVINAAGWLPWRICIRFPGGSTTGSVRPIRERIIQMLVAGGYRWFDWNAGNNDKWLQGNIGHLPMAEYLMQSYHASMEWHEHGDSSQVIFLCHDTVDETVETLPRMIEDMIAKGYEFRTLAQHPDWHN